MNFFKRKKMALNLASPGVKVREVDLTVGRIDGIAQQVGAIAGPFERGPVNTPVLIETEAQLQETFGSPKETDAQNEYWISASTYLSYGGVLRVVRADGDSLANANSDQVAALKIYSQEDFDTVHTNDTNWKFAAKTPGSWANDLKVCVIDDAADQIITGIATTAIVVTTTNTVATVTGDIGVTTTVVTNTNTTLLSVGDIITNSNFEDGTRIVSIGSTTEMTLDDVSANDDPLTGESFFVVRETTTTTPTNLTVGMALTQTSSATFANTDGTTSSFNGYIRGLITEIGSEQVSVKIVDRVDEAGTSTKIEYKNPGQSSQSNGYSFLNSSDSFYATDNTGAQIAEFTDGVGNKTVKDWYDSQTLDIENSTIYWNTLAQKPKTSEYASERSASNDTMHVVVVDQSGKLTGTASNIIEKHTSVSKAFDAKTSPYQGIYFKNYIKDFSKYVYAGYLTASVASGFTPSTSNVKAFTATNGTIGSNAQSTTFNVLGNLSYTFTSGQDYSSTGGMSASLGDIISSYEVFRNPAEYKIDFLINGPSGGDNIYESQAKANYLIGIAEERKDCVACISPHKASVTNTTNSSTQTDNIVEFFDPITSSSYAVLDSGIKYTLDRFNNKFIYLECNADIAGLMARTAVDQYPWFSPAGANRGSLNDAIKLAYNPSQVQRDLLYTKRVNPVIASPGQGIILFGDKTALSFGSAFDRINVRRLFLTIEQAIAKAARSQLFEFNDEITRTNFINIVEPYLRDVKAKRGISEFVVVCDRSNNTPEVIDSNEMVADIFVKPARSINFIGLTFVATRSGVSFTEVVGNV